jgi:nitrite reductase/ring-hydroxylating ferredoxin subunit
MSCEDCKLRQTRRTFLSRLSGSLAAAAFLSRTEVTGVVVSAAERGYAIPDKDGVTIDKAAQIILVRAQQHVYAFALSCPHENTALRWRTNDNRFQCPKHDSKYRPDGTFMAGRATRNMDRFPIRRAGEQVLVDITKVYHSDAHPSEWAAATVAL